MLNKHKKTLKGRKREADDPGILRPKKQYSDEFLGFSSCLIYPTLGAEEASNLKHQGQRHN